MNNLQELNISSVSVIGEISFGESGYGQLSNVLREYQGNRRRPRIDKLGFYEVDGIRHHVGLDIEFVGRATPMFARFMLGVHTFPPSERLGPSTRNKQMQHFSQIEEILSAIGELNLDCRFHSHIDWIFPPGSKKPIIDLPMISIQNSSFPFSDISGIRFRKMTDQGSTTITLDLMSDGSLFATLVSPLLAMAISEKMIDDIVQVGTSAIGDFVFDIDIPLENGGDDR